MLEKYKTSTNSSSTKQHHQSYISCYSTLMTRTGDFYWYLHNSIIKFLITQKELAWYNAWNKLHIISNVQLFNLLKSCRNNSCMIKGTRQIMNLKWLLMRVLKNADVACKSLCLKKKCHNHWFRAHYTKRAIPCLCPATPATSNTNSFHLKN